MRTHDALPERLRQAFASLDMAERGQESCPAPGMIWDAVHLRLSSETVRAVVDHVASCPSCASDWRIAMRSENHMGAATGTDAARSPRPPGTLRTALVAAAALVLGATFLAVFRPGLPTHVGEAHRAAGNEEIVSLVPDDESLPRDNAVLRWRPVGDDARYTVEIDTLDLTPVARTHDIAATEYRIPPEKLAGLASGEVLVWTVEARLVDGRRIKSKAFRQRIR